MNTDRVDFSYQLSDERLLAYSAMPLLDRLRWLDDMRRFTLMARRAPTVIAAGSESAPQQPDISTSEP